MKSWTSRFISQHIPHTWTPEHHLICPPNWETNKPEKVSTLVKALWLLLEPPSSFSDSYASLG